MLAFLIITKTNENFMNVWGENKDSHLKVKLENYASFFLSLEKNIFRGKKCQLLFYKERTVIKNI